MISSEFSMLYWLHFLIFRAYNDEDEYDFILFVYCCSFVKFFMISLYGKNDYFFYFTYAFSEIILIYDD